MATIIREPVRVQIGPTVFIGSVHVRACASPDAQRTVLAHYVEQLDKRLRKLHSVMRWHLVAHETAADAFSIAVIFERAQMAARLDNVAASFVRMLTINVASRNGGESTEYTMARRAWSDCGSAGFIFSDCRPAPEGSYTAAVSAVLSEAKRQAHAGKTPRELSSTQPPMLNKPSINQRAPGRQPHSSLSAPPRQLAGLQAGSTAAAPRPPAGSH